MLIVRKSNVRITAALLALTLGMAGCASIPPDQHSLPQQNIASAALAADIKLARDGWPEAQWWTQYGDAQLNALMSQALANGPTLAVAAARIGTASATLAYNGADRKANVVFNADQTRQRYSSNGLFPAPIGGSFYNETTLQVQGQYDFDWWGKHRAQIAAALGEVNARKADYAQAEQVLAAVITQHYFNLQSDWARSTNLQASVYAQTAILADIKKRIAHGLAAIDTQRTVESDLSYLNQRIAQLDANMIGEREALRALVGADAKALTDLMPQKMVDVAHALPSTLGLNLLARRPDLQAARFRVEASLSRIEVVQAAFYPDINLTASFGLDSIGLGNLLNAASRTLFVGPTLSLPLFDSKRLDARLDSARSERNEMIADYNQSVFNAVRDVAQSGAAMQGIQNQIRLQQAAMQASDDLLHTAQEKFQHGLANNGTVLSAKLNQLAQQDTSLQLQNQQLQAEVSLVSALGGGYQADPISQPASPSQSSK
ncbi:efflux transporter outer membrane subunit [Glaciimonas sp. PAMC28666]|nr:efflux transporter outer membrane subunit [Glaciimonas sp. PAMC28666]